nr:hypothetical protein GCM10020092_048610 [Actinoplanes digitatis]
MLDVGELVAARADRPGAIAAAAAKRRRPVSWRGEHGRMMIIAADHPARGALRAGPDPLAMGNRADLLRRICTALGRPGVNGVLGTPDILEDLLLLGALDDKVVIGSMNRGGLASTSFEMDDRFTAYDGGVSPRPGSPAARCCCASTRTTPEPSPRWRAAGGPSATSPRTG